MERYLKTKKEEYLLELQRELGQEFILDRMFPSIEKQWSRPLCYPSEYIDTHCLEDKINSFTQQYGPLTESALKYVRQIGKHCFLSV